MSRRARLSQENSWAGIAARQYGIISRQQLMELGLSADQARQWIRSGRWQRVLDGVYATFTGPLPERAMLWAAVLHAGPGALVTGRSALWLLGALDDPPPRPIQIAVPNQRRAKSIRGVHITRTRTRSDCEPARGSPPTRTLEEAALDACNAAHQLDSVLDILFRVCQRRLTTAARLTQTLGERSRHRWRQLIEDVLADVRKGVASSLEQRYLKDVERAHGLPPGRRNRPESDRNTTAYRDVRYWQWHIVVELDGRAAHPDELSFRDMRRDNGLTIGGDSTLRYGWHDVAGQPCQVALQVIVLLRGNGWSGLPHSCGPSCPIR